MVSHILKSCLYNLWDGSKHLSWPNRIALMFTLSFAGIDPIISFLFILSLLHQSNHVILLLNIDSNNEFGKLYDGT